MNRRIFTASTLGCLAFGSGLARTAAQPVRGEPITSARFAAMRRFVDLPQGRIAYIEQGRDDQGQAVLFIHGWPLNGYQWRGVIERLSPYARCIAPDLMGMGHSDIPETADLSPVAQAEMLIALLDRLGVTRVDLIANDSGTAIAQILAARYPARVRTMLLTNGDAHTNSPPDALLPAIEAARAGTLVEMIERHFTEPGFAHSPEGLGGICYADPASFTAESMEVYLRPLLASPKMRSQFQQYGVAFLPNPLPALEKALRASQIPVRMVWGDADHLFTTEWAYWLDQAFPHSQGVRVVAGGKLFFPEEFPEIIAEEAIKLWRSGITP